MARGLLAAGRRVVGVDVELGTAGLRGLAEHAAAHGASERLLTLPADVRHAESGDAVVAAALERFGALHALVNNAGLSQYAGPDGKTRRFLDVPIEYWQRVIETNLTGPYLMARVVARHLLAQGWGRIVNVTTSFATMVLPGMTPYGAAKAGLEAATAIWSKDLAGTGVTVNVLVPGGPTDTPMLRPEWRANWETILQPAVMVAPIVWLTSLAADGVTGSRFVGKLWDPNASVAVNLRSAMAPVAWEGGAGPGHG
jgi:3-oxoacyl-[acyl-carrier protein] reductase